MLAVVYREGDLTLYKTYNNSYELYTKFEKPKNIVKVFEMHEGMSNSEYKKNYNSLTDEVLLLLTRNKLHEDSDEYKVKLEFNFQRVIKMDNSVEKLYRVFNPLTEGMKYGNLLFKDKNKIIKSFNKEVTNKEVEIYSLEVELKELNAKVNQMYNDGITSKFHFEVVYDKMKLIEGKILNIQLQINNLNYSLTNTLNYIIDSRDKVDRVS